MTDVTTEPVVAPPASGSAGATGGAVRRARLFALRRPLLFVGLVAFSVRALAALFINVRYGGVLFSDEHLYHLLAVDVSSGHTSKWDDYTRGLYHDSRTLLFPLAVLYRLFGVHILIGQLLAAAAGAGAAVLTTRLCQGRLRPPFAVGAGLAVALLPSQILWSSLTMKDAFSWLLVTGVAVLVAARTDVSARRAVGVLLGVAVLLVLLRSVRTHTMLLTTCAIVAAVVLVRRPDHLRRIASGLLLLLLLPLALGLGLAGEGLVRSHANLSDQRAAGAIGATTALVAALPSPAPAPAPVSPAAAAEAAKAIAEASHADADAQRISALLEATPSPGGAVLQAAERNRLQAELRERRAAAAAARARALAVAPPPSPPAEVVDDTSVTGGVRGNLLYLPRGWAALVLQPYPWQASRSRAMSIAKLEMIVWYPLLALALVGLTGLWRQRDWLAFPVIFGVGAATMWALVEGNFGTAYRHRGEFVWVIVALAALGAQRVVEQGNRRRRSQPAD